MCVLASEHFHQPQHVPDLPSRSLPILERATPPGSLAPQQAGTLRRHDRAQAVLIAQAVAAAGAVSLTSEGKRPSPLGVSRVLEPAGPTGRKVLLSLEGVSGRNDPLLSLPRHKHGLSPVAHVFFSTLQ